MKNAFLVVDDEPDIREILQFNLESEGFAVDTAVSAEQALKLLNENSYQLILLDVMMGGMSGFRMAEKLRKEGISIPIIFLTAKDTENDMLTGFSIGGDDYISKPFSIKEVIARVKAVLKRTEKDSEASGKKKLDFDGLVIDLESKQIHINEMSVMLTKKEFEILYLLFKNPSRVYSREEILDKVWGDESYVLERTVDVHVTRLRKKLGSHAVYIANRSGYGYCFNPDIN
ncbi:MAG: response regulator transcription factor [Dysgonamonadaceae bacterium]|jgi:two-component system alkaline phosphatase synthesis response regulator PhoP|nr:response regulator transcription factor [Dysgonamonadaceae bacterium]